MVWETVERSRDASRVSGGEWRREIIERGSEKL